MDSNNSKETLKTFRTNSEQKMTNSSISLRDSATLGNQPKKQRILTVVNTETGEVEARVQLREKFFRAGWFAFFQKSAVYLAQNLNGEQFRVLMFMLSKIDYGNHIRVTTKTIARNLNMKHTNVSRAIRGLIEKNVLIVEDVFGISRIYLMNPNFLHKGRDVYKTIKGYAEIKEEELHKKENMDQKELEMDFNIENFDPAFLNDMHF